MDSNSWDARYAAAEMVWSAEPNAFVAEVAGDLPPGRALDLACGEGRNAIWLAGRGWTVTAVDFSAVAIDKARRLAGTAGVTIDWAIEDVLAWTPPAGGFDLVLTSYLQLPADKMAGVLFHARTALSPGGHLLVIGHARANLEGGYGGPQDPAVLYEPDDIMAWLGDGDLGVVRAENVTRRVDTPDGPRTAIDALVLEARRG